MRPYYQDKWVTIYHGDCREVLPDLGVIETVITDPVWPNALEVYGVSDSAELFREMCDALPLDLERLVVQLGCDSDPRFLLGIPDWLPFLRVCWLDYARPSFKGRLLYTGDVGYVFGRPPEFIPGRQVMPGMCRSSRSDKMFHRKVGPNRKGSGFDRRPYDNLPHPSARRLEHVRWLVHQFSDAQIVDPFVGSGTTLIAAKHLNRKAIGIEVNEEYCELAAKRLSQSVFDFTEGP